MLQKIKGYHLMAGSLGLLGKYSADGLGLCAKKPVQEPRRASGARSTEAGRQHCFGLDGAEATHSTRC